MKLSEMSQNQTKTSTREKDIKQSYEELKNCSSNELMDRLSNQIREQKVSGKFDYNGLQSSVEQLKNYLPKQTYENMLRILESFK
ncbi:MAG: hypothetical protein E7375_01065 [Clostridiales bacterium]|nr:hypothetical protein [Clostridiales bacterium]